MYEIVMSTEDLKQPSKKCVGFDEAKILELIGLCLHAYAWFCLSLLFSLTFIPSSVNIIRDTW